MGQFIRGATRAVIVYASLLLLAAPAAAQFDRGQISGRVKDAQGAVVPGATVTATNNQTQTTSTTVTDGTGFYTFPNLQAGRYNVSAELQGFKKALRNDVQLDAAGAVTLDFALETGALTEVGDGHGREHGAPDRRRRPQDGRGEGHRAAVVRRPQPDWRARAQSRRRRRQLQQRRVRCLHQRRLQHQRRPLRREHHHRRWRGRDPHAVGRRDHRRAERRRGAGSPGADRQLHARIRPRERRPDPVHHEERQQPVTPASASFFYRDESLQANTWARNRSPNRDRELRSAPFDYKQYGYSVRRPDPGHVQGQDVLLRRAGVGQLLPGADQHGDRADRSHAARRFQRAARPEPVLQLAADHPRSADRTAVPENIIPPGPAVAERHRDHEPVSAADAGFQQGTANAIFNSDNPQDQRKDNLRFDYRLNREQPVHLPLLAAELDGDRCVPRHVPVRADGLGPAELDAELQLDQHHLAAT